MTPIRRLALKISNTVVRYASPGCKQWAEGLAQEVAFVEGDWAALAWALGSVRVLLDYREEPLASLDDLPAVAEKYAISKLNVNVSVIGSISPIVFCEIYYSDKFFHVTNGLERIGCCIVVLCSLALLISQLIESRKRLKVPPPDDVPGVIKFYLEELRRLVYGKFWIMVSAAVLFVGLALSQGGGPRDHPIGDALLGLLCVGTMLLMLLNWRINRRRLDRLEELLAEQS